MKKASFTKRPELRILQTAVSVMLATGPVALAQVYPAPVYVQPAPVYVYPAPAYAYPAPAYVVAPGDEVGFYFAGDIGPSFVPDFNSSRFGFPASFSPDVGVRISGELGYNFLASGGLTLGGEFETGLIYNELGSVSGGGLYYYHGDYYQVPLLANLVLKLHLGSFVVPYIGFGGGGDYSEARVHTHDYYGYSAWSYETDPAIQAMAGVRFPLSPGCELGVGYKFLAAFPSEGTIMTHAALVSVNLRF